MHATRWTGVPRAEDEKVDLITQPREHVGWHADPDFEVRRHADAGCGGNIALKCRDELPLGERIALEHDLFGSQSASHSVIDRAPHLERRAGARRDRDSKVKRCP